MQNARIILMLVGALLCATTLGLFAATEASKDHAVHLLIEGPSDSMPFGGEHLMP
jgi:hypothetical protein